MAYQAEIPPDMRTGPSCSAKKTISVFPRRDKEIEGNRVIFACLFPEGGLAAGGLSTDRASARRINDVR
jgi:hypothetical protein